MQSVKQLTALSLFLAGTFQMAHAQHGSPPDEDVSQVYLEHCSSCHGKGLEGGFGGSLNNQVFRKRWKERGLDKLLQYVALTMPVGSEGSLSKEEYLHTVNDIITVADLGDPIAASIAGNDDFWPDDVIAMEVDWVSKLPTNNDAIAGAESERREGVLQSMAPVTREKLTKPNDADWLHWR